MSWGSHGLGRSQSILEDAIRSPPSLTKKGCRTHKSTPGTSSDFPITWDADNNKDSSTFLARTLRPELRALSRLLEYDLCEGVRMRFQYGTIGELRASSHSSRITSLTQHTFPTRGMIQEESSLQFLVEIAGALTKPYVPTNS
ncbi:hypothetical protein CBL_07327 [Carabus blaptoides fortunei]